MNGAYTLIAISIGAMRGALARYGLSIAMNALVPNIPMGTLACNLIAAYIVGFAIAFFGSTAGLPVAWRLFLITGLAGGLSTFSMFFCRAAELASGWPARVVSRYACATRRRFFTHDYAGHGHALPSSSHLKRSLQCKASQHCAQHHALS